MTDVLWEVGRIALYGIAAIVGFYVVLGLTAFAKGWVSSRLGWLSDVRANRLTMHLVDDAGTMRCVMCGEMSDVDQHRAWRCRNRCSLPAGTISPWIEYDRRARARKPPGA